MTRPNTGRSIDSDITDISDQNRPISGTSILKRDQTNHITIHPKDHDEKSAINHTSQIPDFQLKSKQVAFAENLQDLKLKYAHLPRQGKFYDGVNYTDSGFYINAENPEYQDCLSVTFQYRELEEKYGQEFDWEEYIPVNCLEDAEDILCDYCQDVLCKPLRNDIPECGHLFCYNCIKPMMAEFNGQCSACVEDNRVDANIKASELSFLVPDLTIKEYILMTDMVCPLRHFGCPWLGTVEEFKQHRIDCQFYEEKCECGEFYLRMNTELHNKSCTRRILTCSYCQEPNLRLHQYDEHLKTCPEFEIVCPNVCGDTVKNKNLQRHFDQDCSEVEIVCPYFEAGLECTEKFNRGFTAAHHEMEEIKHLKLLTENLMKINSKSQNLDLAEDFDPEDPNFDQNQIFTDQKILRCQMLNQQAIKYKDEIVEYRKQYNNVYCWKIGNMKKHFKNADANKLFILRSSAFELFPSSYKIQCFLKLRNLPTAKIKKNLEKRQGFTKFNNPFIHKKKNLYFDNEVRDYIGIFFKLVRSNYDNLLDWNFTWKLKVSIKTGSDLETEEYTNFINPLNYHSSNFRQPEIDEIVGMNEDDKQKSCQTEFGNAHFLRIDKLKKMLGEKDCIFVCIQAVENEALMND